MDELIARRKAELAAGDDGRDDVLTRLLKMQSDPENSFDDAGIRRNVGGTILGAIETTSKAATQAFDQLLDRPKLLRKAQEAALADDDQLVFSYVFEALRFNPHNPIIIRHCDRSYIVAKGTKREKEIPQGSTVFAATLAAMFDPEEFPSPNDFRTDRPAGKYIHFGYGLHTCFGEYVNLAQLPGVIKRLLRQPGLRRAAGDDGQMRFDGPFPDSLIVAFDA
jgi:cytochrome P450